MEPSRDFSLIYFMIGCFSLNSIYHYCLFLFYRKNYTALYFALINTLALVFNLLQIFHSGYDQKIGSLIFILNPLLFLYFLTSFFPEEFVKIINRIYTAFSLLLFLIVLFYPNHLYLNVFIYFNKVIMLLMVLDILYIMQGLIRAVVRRREDSITILAGMAVLMVFSISRYLFRDSFVRIPNPIGSLFLMFFYTLTLAKRFSDSYFKREEIIKEKTADLNRINKQLRELAMRDSLTNLYNRRYFFEQSHHFFEQAKRYGKAFSIVIFDIDHFKNINDSYGHLTGDEVLKTLSALLEQNLRKADLSARFGGEEFIFLLSETDLKGAVRVAEKIRKKVSVMKFSNGEDKTFSLTISLGITAYFPVRDDIMSIFDSADAALYHSKNNGRNCSSCMDEAGHLVKIDS